MKTQRHWLGGLMTLGGAMALLVSVGCTTNPGFKGSPFYSGDFKSPPTGVVTNRIPGWPLLYYRDPALSVIWPIFESIGGESFAIRPLFSVYDYDDPTKTEWNVLWPLAHHDNATGEGHAFPFFWGEDYNVGFPLWWRFTAANSVSDLLLPLWWYQSSPQSEGLFTLLFGYSKSGDRSTWLAPLLLSGGSSGPDFAHTHIIWPISYWGHDGSHQSAHVFPLYWHSADPNKVNDLMIPLWWYQASETKSHFYTLLFGHSSDGDRSGWLAPLLLSGGSYGPNSSSTHLIWPLSHWGHEGSAVTSHVFPLWYWDSAEGTFLSLPYCGWTDRGMHYSFIPPLLGAAASSKDGRGEFWALAGLYNREWDKEGLTSDYLFPLYFYAPEKYFYTLLFGFNGKPGDRMRYYLTPLIGSSEHGPENNAWFFPFWHAMENTNTDTHTGHFLWSTWRSSPSQSSSQMFPLWGHERTTTDARSYEHTGALFWLYGSTREKTTTSDESHGRLLPLYYNTTSNNLASGETYDHSSYLLSLYDTKHEVTRDAKSPNGTNDYTRKSLLGYAWRYEKVNGDVSVDFFPGVAYDKKKDGFTQTAFLYKFFRWQRDAEGKRKFDFLFIPFIRD